jgi:hypothetical protein
MANELEYSLRLNASAFSAPLRQAMTEVRQTDAATRQMGVSVDGIRTSMVSAGAGTESLFEKLGRLGANLSNVVGGVKSANEVLGWLKSRGQAAATASTAVATASTAAAVGARSSGAAATAAGAGFGVMAGGAVGAATAVAAVTAVLLPLAAALATVTAGLAAAGLAYQGVARGITLAANLERDLIAFKTLTGTMGAAKGVLQELTAMAAETPFQLPDLTNAAKKLLNAKVPIAALKSEMKALGNISAATGADIGALATVYNQVAGKGKLYAEELQQFVEQGAGLIRGALTDSLKVGTAELMDMMQRGEVGFSALQRAIQELAGETGKLGQALREQSQSTWGMLSTVKDNVDAIFRAFGQPLNDGPVKAALQELVDLSANAAILMNQAIAEGQISEMLRDVFIIGLDMAKDAAVQGAKKIAGVIAEGVAKALDLVSALKNPAKAIGMAIDGDLSISTPDIDGEADAARKRMQDRLNRGKTQLPAPTAPVPKDWPKNLDATTPPTPKKPASESGRQGDSRTQLAQAMDLMKLETAAMLAKAQGQAALATALETELAIRREAASIAQSTGATEAQALAIAQQRWAAQQGIAAAAKAEAESRQKGAKAEAQQAKTASQNQAIDTLKAEFAILQAKALGQNQLADALQRELSIRQEAARIAQATGLSEERALEIARQKAALEAKAAKSSESPADSRYGPDGRRLSDGRKKITGFSRAAAGLRPFGDSPFDWQRQRTQPPVSRITQPTRPPGVTPAGVAQRQQHRRDAEDAAARAIQPRWDLVESIDRRLGSLGLI